MAAVRSVPGTLEFLGALWAADQELRTLSRRMERRLGVTGPQRLALRILGQSPGLQLGGLAAALHLHPSTVTGLAVRLARKGLVRPERDPTDRRRTLLVLTHRGEQVNALRRGTAESAVVRLSRSVGQARLRTAREVLHELRRSVELERRRSGAG